MVPDRQTLPVRHEGVVFASKHGPYVGSVMNRRVEVGIVTDSAREMHLCRIEAKISGMFLFPGNPEVTVAKNFKSWVSTHHKIWKKKFEEGHFYRFLQRQIM